jgi:hypothetical protein
MARGTLEVPCLRKKTPRHGRAAVSVRVSPNCPLILCRGLGILRGPGG